MNKIAKCLCGQLELEIDFEIKKTSMCHCIACQRRTGSVFGVQVRVPKKNVVKIGKYSTYRRTPEGGGWVDHHFCSNCGSNVFWEIDEIPNSFIIAIGSFADENFSYFEFPSPVFSVYRAHKHPWVKLPDSVTEDWD